MSQVRSVCRPKTEPVSLHLRGFWLAIAIVLAALWATAWWLDPSPLGLGTHQRLGLPPCSLRIAFGLRCPACGMTTSWALLADGRPLEALRSNVGGVFLAVTALGVIPLLGWKAWQGTRISHPQMVALAVVLVAALAVTMTDWVIRVMGG